MKVHIRCMQGLFVFLMFYPVASFAAETKSNIWIDVLVAWGPFILLVALYVYYMRGSGIRKNSKLIDRNMEHMDRVEKLLEKIVEQNDNAKK